MNGKRRRRYVGSFVALAGGLVAALGVVTLAGYALHVPCIYQWGSISAPMAVQTALAFALEGAGLCALGALTRRRCCAGEED